MKHISILSQRNNAILFEGRFPSTKAALEAAITENVPLIDANLSHLDLRNANLDDANLSGSTFEGSNLCGANLSEALLSKCRFTNCNLIDVCFFGSLVTDSFFDGVRFGATDIADADISGSHFNTHSCFTLNFIHARRMKNCTFTSPGEHIKIFSYPPIVTYGLASQPVVVIDRKNRLAPHKQRLCG